MFGSQTADRIKGKTILITGASSGIGEQTAADYCKLTDGEINLVLVARRLEKLETLKAEN